MTKNESFPEQEGEVAFQMPYGEDTYGIALSDKDLDQILLSGVERVTSNRSQSPFGFIVELSPTDLPV